VWTTGLVCAALLLGLGGACSIGQPVHAPGSQNNGHDAALAQREAMVARQIEARGVRDPRVLEALRAVPRERFVPEALRAQAYDDRPLSIGHDQTISQPYIVGLMTELAAVDRGARVLEVGTGSGYQAAILSRLAAEVYTIEIVPELGRSSAAILRELGYDNVHVRIGDGFDGWPEHAPFDAIVVTASPAEIPQPLLDQLRIGGRLVIPVGAAAQNLVVVTRTEQGYERRSAIPVRFVPMTGKAQAD
jgi:protein-L-isoaspartate(D-aspartate) O-methyltransferase